MKKNMKTHFKKLSVIAVAIAISFMTACKKDQDHASSVTHYKVTDMTLINNQDGRPRAAGILPVLTADETVALHNEALNTGQITIKNAVGENLMLTIAGNKDGKLNLEQSYAAANGQASGTIYYTLVKN